MPIYVYKGVRRSDGKEVKGLQDADGEKSLRASLKREGILLTELHEKGAGKKRGDVEISFFKRVSKDDIAMFTRQLATLTGAGISLVEALSALIDQNENPEFKSTLTDIRDNVNQGESLSDSFAKHPKLFDKLFCNMVNAGEQSGTLEQVLGRLADFIESSNKLKSKVASSMAYPVFMAIFGIIIITVMMMVVVPKVTEIFSTFEQTLPIYTRALIFMSDTMRNYWWLLIAAMFFAVVGFRKWKVTTAGELKWHKFILSAPLLGSLATMIAISRFSKTLSTLLASGVPVLTAMDITKGVLGNAVLEKVIVDASQSIKEGESISEPLKASGHFPPIVTHMIAVGERSGQLEKMLENVAGAYDTQVETKITTVTSLLEPLMIVLLGAAAGFITVSILMPLINMNEFIAQ